MYVFNFITFNKLDVTLRYFVDHVFLFPGVFCHISYTGRIMEQFESMILFAG